MNPAAKELWQEGASFESFKLVSEGHFDEAGVAEAFAIPGTYPGSSATRRLDHNLTDLQAAVSANVKGSKLVRALFDEFGARTVLFYMRATQTLAEATVKTFFRRVYDDFDGRPLRASDSMDDGTDIKLEVTINRAQGTAVFDWRGCGPQVRACISALEYNLAIAQAHGNFNMPIALTSAAVIVRAGDCLSRVRSTDKYAVHAALDDQQGQSDAAESRCAREERSVTLDCKAVHRRPPTGRDPRQKRLLP